MSRGNYAEEEKDIDRTVEYHLEYHRNVCVSSASPSSYRRVSLSRRKRCSFTPTRRKRDREKEGKIKKKIKSRSNTSDRARLSSERRASFGERASDAARQARAKLHVTPVRLLGPHYGRYLVVGDITANCHPQKRNGPGSTVAGATESADCSVHRALRLATSVLQLEPPRAAPSSSPSRTGPACTFFLSSRVFHSHHTPVRGV